MISTDKRKELLILMESLIPHFEGKQKIGLNIAIESCRLLLNTETITNQYGKVEVVESYPTEELEEVLRFLKLTNESVRQLLIDIPPRKESNGAL